MKKATKKKAAGRKKKAPMVKVSGQTVRAGSKRHAELLLQRRHRETGRKTNPAKKKRRTKNTDLGICVRCGRRKASQLVKAPNGSRDAVCAACALSSGLGAGGHHKNRPAGRATNPATREPCALCDNVQTVSGAGKTWKCRKCGYKANRRTLKSKTRRTKNGLRPAAGKLSPRVGAALKTFAKLPPFKRNQRYGNPDDNDQVKSQFASFHGEKSGGMTSKSDTFLFRSKFAKLGRLLDLNVYLAHEDHEVLLSPNGVQLVVSGDGGSLYFQGGDQELDLEGLGLDHNLPKDYINVGQVTTIAYHTTKGFHNFEPRDYTHDFAVDLPTLGYDTVNKLFFLSGGAYQVRPEGITNGDEQEW